MKYSVLLVLLAVVAAGAARAPDVGGAEPDGPAGGASSTKIEIPGALLKLVEQVDVPAREAGVLAEVNVREGQMVEDGDLLAQIVDTEACTAAERAEIELAIAAKNAENDVNTRFAKKSVEVAAAELRRSRESIQKYPKSISDSEMDRLRLVVERAELEIEQAAHEFAIAALTRRIKENECRSAQENVARHRITAPLGGVVVQVSRHAGEWVERGQTLARLTDWELRRQIVELRAERDLARLTLENLRLRLAGDPSVAPQIPAAKEALADAEERLRARRRDHQRLTLRAPVDGTVLPPPRRQARPDTPGRLPPWRGSPLEAQNLGCYLETGTLYCLVGDPQDLEACVVLDQADVQFVHRGQRVKLRLDQSPGRILAGTIEEIAKTDLKVAPRELAQGEAMAVRVDEQGIPRPVEASYQARVTLDVHDALLLSETRGRAKILVAPQSLFRRLSRYVGRTFRFSL